MKIKKLVIDTDALFALFVETDANHMKAVELRRKIPSDTEIYVANFILAESATLIGRRLGRKFAERFVLQFGGRGFSEVVVDKYMGVVVRKYFLKQTSKDVTYFDCVNMAVAETYCADAIFSFDRGYVQNGFKLLK